MDMENTTVDTQDATIRNADLWTTYFENEWSRWLNPLGPSSAEPMTGMAEGTAARVASFLTLVAAAPIAWMYSSNRPAIGDIARPAVDDDDEADENAA